jgi:hypothetical protein
MVVCNEGFFPGTRYKHGAAEHKRRQHDVDNVMGNLRARVAARARARAGPRHMRRSLLRAVSRAVPLEVPPSPRVPRRAGRQLSPLTTDDFQKHAGGFVVGDSHGSTRPRDDA